jgi:hypothetical protein
MRSSAVAPLLLALLALASSGCGQGGADAATTSKPKCPAALKLGWQTLANRIDTDVYCPAWLPNPLVGKIDKGEAGAADNAVLSVSKDGSYLASWIWVEAQTGEVHVILRAYPGRTTIPACVVTEAGSGKQVKHRAPCFADPHGTVHAGPITATLYTVNQGADQWHVLLAWHRKGSLYTLSQHVAAPLSYEQVVADLKRMLRDLVVVAPRA